VDELVADLSFFLDRLDWLSALDLLLVTTIFFLLLKLVRGTQAVVLLRGMILLVIGIALLTTALPLPAFTWLAVKALPAVLIAIPVIFAPEIRRALERLGRAAGMFAPTSESDRLESIIEAICSASQRLSDQQEGALIVVEREVRLDEYAETGVPLDGLLTPEILLQIFHLNTPLHDGAVILRGNRIVAAACVLPLSASGTLSRSPQRHLGLRHRAALGISEVSDAVAVVVSEETGAISVAHRGRMIRRLDQNRLRNILLAFYRPRPVRVVPDWLQRLLARLSGARAQAPGD
jgi:diadenylate cyclase